MHINSTIYFYVTKMRQLPADKKFCRLAIKATNTSLWHLTACILFVDETWTPEHLFNACKKYTPEAFKNMQDAENILFARTNWATFFVDWTKSWYKATVN